MSFDPLVFGVGSEFLQFHFPVSTVADGTSAERETPFSRPIFFTGGSSVTVAATVISSGDDRDDDGGTACLRRAVDRGIE